MQVGLVASQLKDNPAFNRTAYVFAVFCILLPVTIVGFLLMRHIAGFIWFSAGLMKRAQQVKHSTY